MLCIDQSGSMAASVVYASVFGAVLASMRSIATRLVVFDTAVVDLTDQLDDPVDVLFGTQLGGGTDINRALAYCQSQITRPADTVVVLISDLYEGGIRDEMLKRVAAMKASGVQFVALLALSDEGTPAYDREHAAALSAPGRTGLRVYARPLPGRDGGRDRETTTAHTGHGGSSVTGGLRSPGRNVRASSPIDAERPLPPTGKVSHRVCRSCFLRCCRSARRARGGGPAACGAGARCCGCCCSSAACLTVGFLYGGQAHAAEATVPAESVTTAGTGAAQDVRGATEDVVRRAATSGPSEASGASKSADRAAPVPATDAPKPAQAVRPVREVAERERATARDSARPVTRPLSRSIVEPVAEPLLMSLAESLDGPMTPILARTPGLPHAPGLPQGLTPPLGTPPLDGNEPQTAPQLPSVDNSALNPAFHAGTCGPTAETPAATACGTGPSAWTAPSVRLPLPGPRRTAMPRCPRPGRRRGSRAASCPARSSSPATATHRGRATRRRTRPAVRPSRRLPGAILAAAGEPTRERPGDILEFPG